MPSVGVEVLCVRDLKIRLGSDVSWSFAYLEKDAGGATVSNTFAGWTAQSQIRSRADELWLTQDVTVSVAANKLTVTGHIPAATTDTDAWKSRLNRQGVWDVELVTAGGDVIPLAGGAVILTPQVTKL